MATIDHRLLLENDTCKVVGEREFRRTGPFIETRCAFRLLITVFKMDFLQEVFSWTMGLKGGKRSILTIHAF